MKSNFTIAFILFSFFLHAQDTANTKNIKRYLPVLLNTNCQKFTLSQTLIHSWTTDSSILQDAIIHDIYPFHNGLLIPEIGTGKLFYADTTGKITRIDHSKYGGDRFGAFMFVYNDTIFSMGGYGFWRINGAVRFFNTNTNEWNIIKTNQNIKAANGVNAHFIYHEKQKKIYLLYKAYPEEYIRTESTPSAPEPVQVQIFDLSTKRWLDQSYILNPKIAKEFEDIHKLSSNNTSLFIDSKYSTKTLELDFSKNVLYELGDELNTEIIEWNEQIKDHIQYATDSTIVFVDLSTNEVHNIKTNTTNKKPIDTVYTKPSTLSKINGPHILLAILLLSNFITIVAFVLLYKQKNKQKRLYDPVKDLLEEKDTLTKVKSFTDLLDDMETKVVSLLSKNYKEGKLTSIDEINKTIGIEKRPYKIRNNMRADLLKLINKKFMDFSGSSDELITRERSTFDKRYFEYTLNDRYANKIGNVMVES